MFGLGPAEILIILAVLGMMLLGVAGLVVWLVTRATRAGRQ